MSDTAPDGTADGDAVTPGMALDVLSSLRRRTALFVLDRAPDDQLPVTKAELARNVAQALGDDYQTVYVTLHQNHLTPMAKGGAIEIVDEDDGTIHRGPHFDAYIEALEAAQALFSATEGGDV